MAKKNVFRKSLRTAFIRVAERNETEKGIVIYDQDEIKKIMRNWAKSTKMDYFFIKHNVEETDKNPHYHIIIKFSFPQRFDSIKERFPYGKIEPAKSIRNCVQYLVHANTPDKIQYKWEEITTNNSKGLRLYSLPLKSEDEFEIRQVVEEIKDGAIREYNVVSKISVHLWCRYRKRIEDAISYFYKNKAMTVNRNISNAFIFGKSGVGKTSWVKEFCRRKGYSLCVSSSSNDPMQDYKGEDVLLLDDLRDTTFTYADLLKILDPYTKSTAKSRYSNKLFIGKMIIIASTQRLDDWYFYEEAEDKKQLYRRLQRQYQMDEDVVKCFKYNEKYRKYDLVRIIENPFKNIIRKKSVDIALDDLPTSKDITEAQIDKILIRPGSSAEAQERTTENIIDSWGKDSII